MMSLKQAFMLATYAGAFMLAALPFEMAWKARRARKAKAAREAKARAAREACARYRATAPRP